MKSILPILTFAVLAACSKPIEGFWIDKNEGELLKFGEDSVISYFLNFSVGDTLRYRITSDSIYFSGVNPAISGPPLQFSRKYLLADDSLFIWSGPEFKYAFFKSNANNLKEYLLSKGGLEIKLPRAENVKRIGRRSLALNVRIGYQGEVIRIFVDDKLTDDENIDAAIMEFQQSIDEIDRYNITAQLFIDERVSCNYMFLMFDHLRANDIMRISIISENDDDNPYRDFFSGLRYHIRPMKVNYIVKE